MAARRIQRSRPGAPASGFVVRPQWEYAAAAGGVLRAHRGQLSADEQERLYYLMGSAVHEAGLFDAQLRLEHFSGSEAHVDEVKAQLLEEDFLQEQIDNLQSIAKRMRKGDTKDALEAAIIDLTQKRDEAVQSSEYASEELGKLETAIGKLF